MAILDIFKKKKEKKEEKKPEKKIEKTKKEVIKVEKTKEKIEKPKKAEKVKPSVKKPFFGQVLKEPHITEKATLLAEKNFYVFKVFPNSNKKEVKKAVESIYGVDVLDVNIVNVPRKQRRVGKFLGWRKGYKKAVVKVKEGQKIEVAPR